MAARSDGSAAIVRLLLAAGADAKAVDAFKANTLHAATRRQRHRDHPADRRCRRRRECRRLRRIHAADSRRRQQKSRRRPAAARERAPTSNARSGDGSFQKVKAGTIALGYFTPLTASVALGVSRSGQDAARRRRQAQRARRARHDAADAGGGQRSPEHRRDSPADRARRRRQREEPGRGDGARLGASRSAPKPAIDALGPRRRQSRRARARCRFRPPPHADVRTAVERSRALLSKASVVVRRERRLRVVPLVTTSSIPSIASPSRKGLARDEKLIAQRQTLTKAPYFSRRRICSSISRTRAVLRLRRCSR